jgi:acyl dehydratase
MVEANTQDSDERLYLDDLLLGQRFTSRTRVIDEAQIKAFAQQFDPQPFHQDGFLILLAGVLFRGF